MRFQTATMVFLFALVACNSTPQAQQEPVPPVVIVVEEAAKKEEPKPAPIKPKVEKKPEDKRADKICPPVEGESESQRIIRKLDCLIERD